ncbi:MAG: hypothetical protein H6825_09060 [Planctomycetes bacterium]|nr:hypothetical protein [Planctomycetota bacterium]
MAVRVHKPDRARAEEPSRTRSPTRAPFEVLAARVLGVALPLLEVARRRTDFSDVPAYVDDFIAGAFLLWAARNVSRGRRHGRAQLAAAWGVLCGGLYSSVFGQLAVTSANDVSGLPNGVVVAIKLALAALAVACLLLTVHRTTRDVAP